LKNNTLCLVLGTQATQGLESATNKQVYCSDFIDVFNTRLSDPSDEFETPKKRKKLAAIFRSCIANCILV
jgi:hypothetical protein